MRMGGDRLCPCCCRGKKGFQETMVGGKGFWEMALIKKKDWQHDSQGDGGFAAPIINVFFKFALRISKISLRQFVFVQCIY